jgi:hypothetical protein
MTRQFGTGATRDTDFSKIDPEGAISPLVLRRFAEYMRECQTRNVPPGQTVRSSDNWQKGIPLDSYAKSHARHTLDFLQLHDGFPVIDNKGQPVTIEVALCAILFNVQGYLFELLKQSVTSAPSDGK